MSTSNTGQRTIERRGKPALVIDPAFGPFPFELGSLFDERRTNDLDDPRRPDLVKWAARFSREPIRRSAEARFLRRRVDPFDIRSIIHRAETARDKYARAHALEFMIQWRMWDDTDRR